MWINGENKSHLWHHYLISPPFLRPGLFGCLLQDVSKMLIYWVYFAPKENVTLVVSQAKLVCYDTTLALDPKLWAKKGKRYLVVLRACRKSQHHATKLKLFKSCQGDHESAGQRNRYRVMSSTRWHSLALFRCRLQGAQSFLPLQNVLGALETFSFATKLVKSSAT